MSTPDTGAPSSSSVALKVTVALELLTGFRTPEMVTCDFPGTVVVVVVVGNVVVVVGNVVVVEVVVVEVVGKVDEGPVVEGRVDDDVVLATGSPVSSMTTCPFSTDSLVWELAASSATTNPSAMAPSNSAYSTSEAPRSTAPGLFVPRTCLSEFDPQVPR